MVPSKSIQEVKKLEKQVGSINGDSLSDEHSTSQKDDSSKTGESKSSSDDASVPNRKERLGQAETNAVFRLRLVVLLVLLLAATAVSVTIYIITSGAEQKEFESQFDGAASKVLETFNNVVEQKVAAISALAVAIIAHGIDHSRSWPFVTLSSFQQRSSTARKLADALFVTISPIVSDKNRKEWEDFVTLDDSYWMEEGYAYQEELGLSKYLADAYDTESGLPEAPVNDAPGNETGLGAYPIFNIGDDAGYTVDSGPGPYIPVWQTSPVLKRNLVNFNLVRDSLLGPDAQRCLDTGEVVIGGFDSAPVGGIDSEAVKTAHYASLLSIAAEEATVYDGDPMSDIFLPVFDSFNADRNTVAVLTATVNWKDFFRGILPYTVNGLNFILENTCDGSHTYEINGQDVTYVGPGDLHESKYSGLRQSANFDDEQKIEDGTRTGLELNQHGCKYSIHVYPSQGFSDDYNTSTPIIITCAVAIIFIFTVIMFIIYDRLVEKRQSIILRKATQTSALVSSLFPENVRDRLMNSGNTDKAGNFMAPNHRLKSYLKGGADSAISDSLDMAPIADLVPHATVLFADISGFTAWSSTRDPAQVFILLQNVYQAFDIIAKRRRVFKVETIGDSYVAVTGLPEPQSNHAVIMAKFAGECLLKMNQVTRDLEVVLGPDTGDLSMRFGVHSGPVTAGVLRGERARFQLFGDTVNTASRMESTGIRNKIQTSQATADLLIEAGKEAWVTPRKDMVRAKGKGVLATFWLTPNASSKITSATSDEHNSPGGGQGVPLETGVVSREDPDAALKHGRLVEWTAEIFQEHIRKIVAQKGKGHMGPPPAAYQPQAEKTYLDEVAEVIKLPKFDPTIFAKADAWQSIELDQIVSTQLHQYIEIIASMYRSNPFHNFEHACHVTMAVNKLLKRISTPDLEDLRVGDAYKGEIASHLHDYTHGINSDQLTIFAIVFSALIHDVDHSGVSNAQVIKEDKEMATLYKNKSVAEQNSLDIAWDLLMSPDFTGLRNCLFATQTELLRFRQVIVNVVLATDIFDKELNDLRKKRWTKAFSGDEASTEDFQNLRATIVIEHIIQASDVAHTMQHWHIYCKWNRRLFHEMYRAFKAGRMAKDPSEFWYQGELGFFDNYIIPLAKKLEDCNVFGVSSDECLNYAVKNRAEWEERGREIVGEMIEDVKKINFDEVCVQQKEDSKSTDIV